MTDCPQKQSIKLSAEILEVEQARRTLEHIVVHARRASIRNSIFAGLGLYGASLFGYGLSIQNERLTYLPETGITVAVLTALAACISGVRAALARRAFARYSAEHPRDASVLLRQRLDRAVPEEVSTLEKMLLQGK